MKTHVNGPFCQSCGMPMGETGENYGTEKNGEKSREYCKYCYDNGAFTSECTMEEMIETCVPMMASPESGLTQEQAREMMNAFLPSLKRWKQA